MKRAYYSDQLGYETVRIPNEYIRTDLARISKALAEAAKIREQQIVQGLKK